MIRAALPSDATEAAGVSRLARLHAMPWLPNLHSAEDDRAFFERLVAENRLDVVEHSGQIVGLCSFRTGWIDQLYIHPDYQSQGYGTAFLVRAQSLSDTLQLWVFERNAAAQDFYARHGFKVVERTDGSRNEEQCPDLRMMWTKDMPDA